MALVMLALAIAAFLLSIVGLWQRQGRSLKGWSANLLALCVLLLYVFD
ncbi:MAG: hypothetical protein ACFB16_04430 [Phormidesmis sp.]